MDILNENVMVLKPGCTINNDSTSFCFYCPGALSVSCIIFDDYEKESGVHHEMAEGLNGYWHLTIDENLAVYWYGYKAKFDAPKNALQTPYGDRIFADPYSKHVVVNNSYRQEAKSCIFEDNFDWEGDTHQFPDDPRDLIIYETHIKDVTAHPATQSNKKGFYNKFADGDHPGGINHLKKLGVNCVEFLPLQKFPPIEPPYGEETEEGFHNTWNVYSANYWGYMTSFFFAPESSFASDFSNRFSGKTTAAVTEFKQMVKKLHKENITVIMDVVYNHTSLFDVNPFTHLLPDEYLRTNKKGELMNRSGTGNEFRSENPEARRLIIDSLLYWMEEYHIDGFRFDLAALLDRKTWDIIKKEVHKKYPGAVLIAEPWGGYYSPHHFSDHGWASWNDRIRNTIKGSDPLHDKGFIFSDWQHETNRKRLENVFKGTLNHGEGGLYNTSAHSVNYLESHDGYTLGDFIRIATKPERHEEKVKNRNEHITLSDEETRIAKFAALSLFVSQGICMIHAGQEFARSKIIARTPCNDPDEGKMDHNSYQKDNETNWINFNEIKLNKSLFEYYRGIIDIRKQSPALRMSDPKSIHFEHYSDPLLVIFHINGESAGDVYDYFVILNGCASNNFDCQLPGGTWELLANNNIASSQTIDILSGKVNISAKSGMLLRRLRH